jgi:uncharacterized damage-inducible protein DinB
VTIGDRTQPFTPTKVEDFSSFDALRSYARAYHDQAVPLISALSDAQLDEPVSIVWFKDPRRLRWPRRSQCSMHSHYHRGQNAARLRELGGEPPTTDLIVWRGGPPGRGDMTWTTGSG